MFEGRKKTISLRALHTPNLSINLVSISRLDEKGISTHISKGVAIFSDPEGRLFMQAKSVNSMYCLDFEGADVTALAANSWAKPADRETWHQHLGHIGNTRLDTLMAKDTVRGLDVVDGDERGMCEDCIAGKQTRRPFDGEHKWEREIGERVYMDLWGPAQITGIGGMHFLFHAVDGHSAAVWTFGLKSKEATNMLEVTLTG
ncbi:unnamed protein product [Mycena citricolor]|uniref:GAG-pre-integrase domain-containing protein n=1 Tax=Mycena citricolor TaxID=2018698 RepID=A0AAD2K2D8_9AGAR|nr:unnamed protein product [Mycena citricolor]